MSIGQQAFWTKMESATGTAVVGNRTPGGVRGSGGDPAAYSIIQQLVKLKILKLIIVFPKRDNLFGGLF